jgi:hypothetical protein
MPLCISSGIRSTPSNTSTHPTSAMENSPLARLPGELRNMVYDECFFSPPSDGIDITFHHDEQTEQLIASTTSAHRLANTCQQIRSETLGLAHASLSQNTINIRLDDFTTRFQPGRGPKTDPKGRPLDAYPRAFLALFDAEQASRIRHIHLCLGDHHQLDGGRELPGGRSAEEGSDEEPRRSGVGCQVETPERWDRELAPLAGDVVRCFRNILRQRLLHPAWEMTVTFGFEYNDAGTKNHPSRPLRFRVPVPVHRGRNVADGAAADERREAEIPGDEVCAAEPQDLKAARAVGKISGRSLGSWRTSCGGVLLRFLALRMCWGEGFEFREGFGRFWGWWKGEGWRLALGVLCGVGLLTWTVDVIDFMCWARNRKKLDACGHPKAKWITVSI